MTRPRSRVPHVAVLVVAALGLALLIWRFRWTCDDAYISFRYAQNLANGHGLRFNVADPPIEGYSNFLWVLVAALWERLGVDVPTAMNALSAATAILLLAAVGRRLARAGTGPWSAAVALGLLATCPTIALWSTSGLATLPNALLLFLLWDRALPPRGSGRRPNAATLAILVVPAILMRADAFLWVFAILGAARLLQRHEPDAARALTRALVVAAITWLALTAFRQLYFGDWLPNTARVKAGFSGLRLERGLRYVALFAATFPGVALACAFGVLAARPWRSGPDGSAGRSVAALVVVLAVAYAIWVGGDFMAMGRLLVVALPFAAVLLGEALGDRSRRAALALGAPLLVFAATSSLLVAFDRYVVPEAWRERLHFRWNTPVFQSEWKQWWIMRKRCEQWARLGRELNARLEPGTSLVTGTIGAVGYHGALHLHDLHGLVNRLGADTPPRDPRRSPGHDREIPVERFLELDPDLLNAELVPRTKLDYNLPRYLRPGSPDLGDVETQYWTTSDPDALVRVVWWRGAD